MSWKSLRKALWSVVVFAGSCYTINGGVILVDYYARPSVRAEREQKETLEVSVCNVHSEIGPQQVTLVGETHLYTKGDGRMAQRILAQHDVLFSEGSSDEAPCKKYEPSPAVALPAILGLQMYALGSGRYLRNDTLQSLAQKQKMDVVFLEEATCGGIDTIGDQLPRLEAQLVLLGLAAPASYWLGRLESSGFVHRKKHSENSEFYRKVLTQRNTDMANELMLNLKKYSEETRVVAMVGRAHLPGMMQELGCYAK